ncbi:hypothetical protein LEP1GSC058_2698 [Leptospira fainei serovar Hurstbridge str. BUT 6]|uniref:Uncharacterized protein n=1 Tax=Leptospira fainei serovar Hurstbridge str. BUT 6 TaxID=1193011 RepID=S3VB34_9LEPT|nr:hypothetical protein LEP1GSC058_2698 [Leptospira fainei serovar Hurstbridge str. BUT 6]
MKSAVKFRSIVDFDLIILKWIEGEFTRIIEILINKVIRNSNTFCVTS